MRPAEKRVFLCKGNRIIIDWGMNHDAEVYLRNSYNNIKLKTIDYFGGCLQVGKRGDIILGMI